MAYSFAAGDYVQPVSAAGVLAVSFWIKSPGATANMVAVSDGVATNSDPSYLIWLNDAAGKVRTSCKTGVQTAATGNGVTVNNGAWHHIVENFNYASGGTNTQYVDGAVDGTPVNSSAAWAAGGGSCVRRIGRAADAFWGSFTGSIAEVGFYNRRLTTDEVSALNKGFSPPKVARTALVGYLPLVRNAVDTASATSVSGTSVVDHPRIF